MKRLNHDLLSNALVLAAISCGPVVREVARFNPPGEVSPDHYTGGHPRGKAPKGVDRLIRRRRAIAKKSRARNRG